RLEAQNQELLTEIKALREQLGRSSQAVSSPTAPVVADVPTEDRVEVQERRIAEMDQAKVGSDHRLPVSLTGMVLFNAFLNGKGAGGGQYPVLASGVRQSSAGGSFRQSLIGLKYDGPEVVGGGKVSGSIYMDFFSGNTGLAQTMRLRVANLDVAWKNTTIS